MYIQEILEDITNISTKCLSVQKIYMYRHVDMKLHKIKNFVVILIKVCI